MGAGKASGGMQRGMKKYGWLAAATAVAITGVLTAGSLMKPETVEVKTYTLEERAVEKTVSCTGKIEAAESRKVYTDISCVMQDVPVTAGQQVEKGDVLFTVDVDATTSASVLAPGNAAKLASWIQQEGGGDLHSIVVEEPYSSDYDECLDRAADEKADNARPALASHVDNMEDYDIVFLGFPNWWYTLPMPVLTFVEEYDWSGKTVVPFVTHGTGGLSGTIRDLTAALPEDVTILEPIGVYRPEVDDSQTAVQAWIAGLDLEV